MQHDLLIETNLLKTLHPDTYPNTFKRNKSRIHHPIPFQSNFKKGSTYFPWQRGFSSQYKRLLKYYIPKSKKEKQINHLQTINIPKRKMSYGRNLIFFLFLLLFRNNFLSLNYTFLNIRKRTIEQWHSIVSLWTHKL